MAEPSKLTVDLRLGECLVMHGVVRVELIHKSGQSARLQITAPPEITIEKKSLGHANVVARMTD
jgi:sRNA-binding carbon storage regulator CsrA